MYILENIKIPVVWMKYMQASDFSKYATLTVVGAGAVTGVGLATGSPVIPLLAVIVGMALVIYMKTRVDDAREDEIIYKTSMRAAKTTLWIFGPASAVLGVSLISLRKWLSPGLVTAGYFLCFVAVTLLVTYYATYVYY
ncbi:MAG TPA: DUF2178 domain-containing protein, partial [archaeon]|nr:DUF2178 domain-containing protein [archaeon]